MPCPTKVGFVLGAKSACLLEQMEEFPVGFLSYAKLNCRPLNVSCRKPNTQTGALSFFRPMRRFVMQRIICRRCWRDAIEYPHRLILQVDADGLVELTYQQDCVPASRDKDERYIPFAGLSVMGT